ncbi:MAG TPA: MFS transporter [Mycobacteriales bacterium]|nr:MFS transporter [Mycobacteriales bacterium]
MATVHDLTGAPLDSGTAGSILRDRRFARYWSANAVSVIGDQVGAVAVPLTAALVLDANAAQMGLLTAAVWVPHLLFSLPFGAWIDASSRRRQLMVLTDLARGAVVALVPLAYALDRLSMPLLYAVVLLVGTLTVAFDQCSSSLLSLVAPRGRLAEASSWLNGSRAASYVGGPPVAGLLVAALRAPFAMLVDAASFVLSAAMLRGLPVDEPDVLPLEGVRLRTRIAEGLSFIWRHPVLRPFYVCASTINFFNFMFSAVLVLYMSRTLALSPQLIGLVLGAGAVGGLAGAAIASRLTRRIGIGHTLVLGVVLFAAGPLLVPLAGLNGIPAVPLLIAAEVIAGVGVMLLDVPAGVLIMTLVPYRMRARAGASGRVVNYGIRPFGALAGGAVGQAFGLRTAITVAGVGGLTAIALGWWSPVRRIHDEPEQAV